MFLYLFIRHETNYDMSSFLNELKTSMQRSYWIMEYQQGWFKKMLETEGSELLKDLWKEEFRVLPTKFNYIIDQVRDNLERQDTYLRKSVTIKKGQSVFYGVSHRAFFEFAK